MPEHTAAVTTPEALRRTAEVPAPLVRLQHAGVRFNDVQALADVSLALHRGERLALVGANGSGKTTLLRVLHGLLPHDGQRTVQGSIEPVMAMLFQRPFVLS